jgi:hypothetical protein
MVSTSRAVNTTDRMSLLLWDGSGILAARKEKDARIVGFAYGTAVDSVALPGTEEESS